MYYHANAPRLRYAPLYIQLAAAGGIALLGGVVCAVTHIYLAPSPGATDMLSVINGNMAALSLRASNWPLLYCAIDGCPIPSVCAAWSGKLYTSHPEASHCTCGRGTYSPKSAASV